MHQSVLHKRKLKLENLKKGNKKNEQAKQSPRETDAARTLMMIEWMKGMLKQTDEHQIKRRKTTLDQTDESIPKDIDKWLKESLKEQSEQQYSEFVKLLSARSAKHSATDLEEEALELYNQVLIKCLNEKKEISGRSDDVLFMKTCGLTKQDLRHKEDLEKMINLEV